MEPLIELPSVAGVEFRRIRNFPHYCVGDDGSVWSCRVTKRFRRWEWRPIRGSTEDGYLIVQLYNDYATVREVRVHVLVLEEFIGLRPPGLVSRHLDSNPSNNARSNLCWGTELENAQDRERYRVTRGLSYPGGRPRKT